MVALGMAPHPGSPTVAALDWNGSLLGSIKVPSTSAGLRNCTSSHPSLPLVNGRLKVQGTALWLSS